VVYSGRIVSGGTNAIDNHHNYHNKYHYYKFYHDNHHFASTPTGGPAFVAYASGYDNDHNYNSRPNLDFLNNDLYYDNHDDAPAHNDDDYARSYYDDGSTDYDFATHNDNFAAYYNFGPHHNDLAPDHYYYPSDYIDNINPEGYDYFAKWDRYFNSSSS